MFPRQLVKAGKRLPKKGCNPASGGFDRLVQDLIVRDSEE
jgi:hypothetical protein